MSDAPPADRPKWMDAPQQPIGQAFRAAVDGLRGDARLRARWNVLLRLARRDLPLARLVEAHLDAGAITAELAGPRIRPGQRWAVWAAEPPDGRVAARRDATGAWRLSGTKRWCSGAHECTHALVTAHAEDGGRLFAVDLDHPGIAAGSGAWVGPGMRGADTESVEFRDAQGDALGGPSAYLQRPGFWWAAIGVAACWYGGALGVAAPLRAARRRLDAHGLAHLGAVDGALHAARCALRTAAEDIEHAGTDDIRTARVRALRTRHLVECSATRVMDRVGRALGPAPLAHDEEHATRVADLTVYIRQSHAERDLATLGELADEQDAL